MPDDDYAILDVEEFLTDEDKKSRISIALLLTVQKNETPSTYPHNTPKNNQIAIQTLKFQIQRHSLLNPFPSRKVRKEQINKLRPSIKKWLFLPWSHLSRFAWSTTKRAGSLPRRFS